MRKKPAVKTAPGITELDLPPPPLDGELRFDEATRNGAADDFGHIVHETPEAVLLPGSADDVAKTIQWTARRGRKFAAQGQSHATFGRSQVRDGIVADMSTLRNIGAVEGDRVVVEAGAKWSEVLSATLPQGKTPPVLTDYIELSVGGTLVVGGVGGTTSAFGVQSDNVIEIEVVTGKGQRVTCSASDNADLFNAVRAGLGQVGVITKATLKLVAAPKSVRRFLFFYPDLTTMLNDERLLSGDSRFDAVQGAIVAAPSGGFAFRLDAAKYFTENPPEDNALLAGLSTTRPSGSRRRSRTSTTSLRMPSEDKCYAFNLVRIPATDDASEARQLVDANKAIYDRVKAAGATLYPVSAFPLSEGEWREHFGAAFGQLDAAKQKYDPGKVLTPGYNIF
ncbi:MAG: FAD-binding protein [Solirubrobacterales bacterium]